MRTVVTNLRIPEASYLMIRTAAAAEGISINEYLKRMITETATRENLGFDKQDMAAGAGKYSVWDLGELAKRVKRRPMGKLSQDDTTIYGQ